MKLLLRAAALIFVVALLLIQFAVWTIERQVRALVPPLSAEGCWAAVCVNNMTADEAAAALEAQPGIDPASVTIVPGVQDYGFGLSFTYHQPDQQPVAVLLLSSPFRVVLSQDWRIPDGMPLARLGDLITRIGEPSEVIPLPENTMLYFREPNLWIIVDHPLNGADAVRLLPSAPVTAMIVIEGGNVDLTDVLSPVVRTYRAFMVHWKGFGLYGT